MNACIFCRLVTLFGLVFTLAACEVFRASFSETVTQINAQERVFRLDISDQHLRELPINVSSHTHLRMVDLSGNVDLDIDTALAQLCQLPQLRILKLNRLNLLKVPESIKACTHLRQLSLTHNPKLDFANLMTNLNFLNLAFLDLSHNELSALPSNLGKLRLRDIRLSHNQLGSSEDYLILGQNDNLFSVWFDNNQITTIPPEIQALKNVGYLYYDHNCLRELPEEMSEMPRIGGLWLGHNCFVKIPEQLAYNGVLMAYLNNNQISQIPSVFKNGTIRLRGIVLDNNQLNKTQTDFLSERFKHMFIYSDANQNSL